MALQVFSAGQTLTASQMNTLQASTYNYAVATVSGSSRTLAATDAGYILIFTSDAEPVEVTVPLNLSLAAGDSIEIIYGGTGSLEIIPASGVTIHSEGSLLTIENQWARVALIRTSLNTYILSWMTSVNTAEIENLSVTTEKINNNAVTLGVKTSGDYVSSLTAGTGITLSNNSGEGATPTIAIGQSVATTDTPQFAGLTVNGTTKIEEIIETVATGAALNGATTIHALSGGIFFRNANATGDFTFNIIGNGTTPLNTMMSDNQSLTLVVLNQNGATPRKLTDIKIDTTTTPTIRWFGGQSYPSGNANSVDAYTITIIKTASGVFTVFANQSQFA